MKTSGFKRHKIGLSYVCIGLLFAGFAQNPAHAQNVQKTQSKMTSVVVGGQKQANPQRTISQSEDFNPQEFIENYNPEDFINPQAMPGLELPPDFKMPEIKDFDPRDYGIPDWVNNDFSMPNMSFPEEAITKGTSSSAFLTGPSAFVFTEDCGTTIPSCTPTPTRIYADHCETRRDVSEHLADEMNDHRDWYFSTFLRDLIIPALQRFNEQMVATAMLQTFSIGTFFDAKHQLETQRLFQELQFEAHKDYQPSKGFCTIGTAVRSIANTESAGRHTALVLSRRQMARHLGNKNVGGALDAVEDKKIRWQQFLNHYCDPEDNDWVSGKADTGLTVACGATGPGNTDRVNIDIDYTRAIENRRTIDNFGPIWYGADHEFDTMALGNNLYGHNLITRDIAGANVEDETFALNYLKLRSIAAKRSVAENSFNAIVGMKSLGSTIYTRAAEGVQTHMFLGRILQDLGIPEREIVDYLGLNSASATISVGNTDLSHYAQLEILAKKIYQNPNFYAQLYDTPANVKRKGAALKAIELMLDRAIYESQLRQEMAMSVLLATRLQKSVEETSSILGGAN